MQSSQVASLDAAWRARVAAAPQDAAVLHGDLAWSAADLDARVDAMAAGLEDAGIAPGDRVGLLLQNVPDALTTLLAAWRRGATVALLNPMYAGEELRHLLRDSGARLVVTDSSLCATLAEAATGTEVATVWATTDTGTDDQPPVPADVTALADVLDRHADQAPTPVDSDTDTVALLTYTSGTTGPPKGAMNTHGNVLAVAAGVREQMGLSGEDRVLCVAPVFHITGAVITSAAPLLAGSAVVLVGRTSPDKIAEACTRHGVTTTTGSITVYHGLSQAEGVDRDTFATVKHLWSGGAPVPPATVARFAESFGPYIHNIFGMTETTSACIAVPLGEQAPVDPETGSLAIGKPYPGVEVRVLDPTGEPLGPREHGELEITGACIVPGYWQNEAATAETMPGGRLRSGDGAMVDEDGWVYIVDRLKDQINTSGYKVWPREVEDVLTRHDDVHQAAVVGEPDDYRGEAVVAHVVLDSGGTATAEELVAFARERLAAYKVPRRVVLTDALPTTATGKIQRRALRES
ncbi:AMP-binding protein [Nocardioides panacisoli]|uniref:class I adenylate-forming enzyme family protein n=1 Tax=Nocardioides panacisoli TaxID=627624 RepID=UPI001C629325|nr:AMP-binding protein [Nocardioides panacisoli]QYJ03244.1 AMP-binding protein [Nocardioides panacisoli]